MCKCGKNCGNRYCEREEKHHRSRHHGSNNHNRSFCNGVISDSESNQGLQGPIGPVGLIGPVGPQGSGSIGPCGPTGPQGLVGSPGPIGNIGPQGIQGPIGPTGPVGDIGPQGPIGNTGPQGIQGPVGPQGPIGNIGPQGSIGNTGPQGVQGPIGPQGVQGPIGPQGVQGPIGNSTTAMITFSSGIFSTGIGANPSLLSATSNNNLLLGFGNSVLSTKNITFPSVGNNIIPGGFSFVVPVNAIITGLQVSVDMLISNNPSSINNQAITYDFKAFMSNQQAGFGNDNISHPTQLYTFNGLSCSLIIAGPLNLVGANTEVSSIGKTTTSLTVLQGQRIGVSVSTSASQSEIVSAFSQISFSATLTYIVP